MSSVFILYSSLATLHGSTLMEIKTVTATSVENIGRCYAAARSTRVYTLPRLYDFRSKRHQIVNADSVGTSGQEALASDLLLAGTEDPDPEQNLAGLNGFLVASRMPGQ
jgi:hypothetical protein